MLLKKDSSVKVLLFILAYNHPFCGKDRHTGLHIFRHHTLSSRLFLQFFCFLLKTPGNAAFTLYLVPFESHDLYIFIRKHICFFVVVYIQGDLDNWRWPKHLILL